MSTSIGDNTKKKRGRKVTTGKGTLIGVRLLPPNLAPLDAWIASQPEPRPSRPEAIRFALRDWLASQSAAVKAPALPPPSPAFQTSASAKALAKARKSRAGGPGVRPRKGAK
jgi:hypothetical protein